MRHCGYLSAPSAGERGAMADVAHTYAARTYAARAHVLKSRARDRLRPALLSFACTRFEIAGTDSPGGGTGLRWGGGLRKVLTSHP